MRKAGDLRKAEAKDPLATGVTVPAMVCGPTDPGFTRESAIGQEAK